MPPDPTDRSFRSAHGEGSGGVAPPADRSSKIGFGRASRVRLKYIRQPGLSQFLRVSFSGPIRAPSGQISPRRVRPPRPTWPPRVTDLNPRRSPTPDPDRSPSEPGPNSTRDPELSDGRYITSPTANRQLPEARRHAPPRLSSREGASREGALPALSHGVGTLPLQCPRRPHLRLNSVRGGLIPGP